MYLSQWLFSNLYYVGCGHSCFSKWGLLYTGIISFCSWVDMIPLLCIFLSLRDHPCQHYKKGIAIHIITLCFMTVSKKLKNQQLEKLKWELLRKKILFCEPVQEMLSQQVFHVCVSSLRISFNMFFYHILSLPQLLTDPSTFLPAKVMLFP